MRKPRVCIPGATYHITARTNRKELLLKSAVAKDLFIQILVAAKARYSFRIDNFVVMENHVHLLFTPTGKQSMAEIMRWIMGVYAISWNKTFKKCGRLWGERYFSRPITGISDYVRVYTYIDNNPVEASLVFQAEDYPWCGSFHHKKGRYDIIDPMPPWMLPGRERNGQIVIEGQSPS